MKKTAFIFYILISIVLILFIILNAIKIKVLSLSGEFLPEVGLIMVSIALLDFLNIIYLIGLVIHWFPKSIKNKGLIYIIILKIRDLKLAYKIIYILIILFFIYFFYTIVSGISTNWEFYIFPVGIPVFFILIYILYKRDQ